MPESQQQQNNTAKRFGAAAQNQAPDARLAEQSFAIHMEYGGEYMDENPITGKPGEFRVSSTGRKDYHSIANKQQLGLPSINTSVASKAPPISGVKTKSPSKKDAGGGSPKTPKTPTGLSGGQKPKRKKSKGPGATPTPTSATVPH